METSFLGISILLFLLRFGLSINTMMLASASNVTCTESERQSLLAFKQSLTDEYDLLSTWRGVECCEWKGVGCDSRNGHVVKLDLRTSSPGPLDIFLDYKLLAGKLSPRLQNLKHLRYLDLSMNYFTGNIPVFFGSFESLVYLNLSCTGFVGVVPHHLGNLSRLQYLDLKTDSCLLYTNVSIDDFRWVSLLSSLKHLDLSGIPIGEHIYWFHPINMLPSLMTLNLASSHINNLPSVELVNFTSLNALDLSFNFINSTLPVWLSNLTHLMHLNLHNNHFYGKIPDFLGMCRALVSIDLSSNSFDSSMPDLLSDLVSLVHLDLSSNSLSGPVPANIGVLLKLEDLYLQRNELSGNIPTSLGQLSNLKNLDLSRNQLRGNIPTALWQLPNLKHLDLSYNSLVGVLSETHFTNQTNLTFLSLSSNSLELNFSSRWIAPFQLQIFLAGSCKIGPRFPNWIQTQEKLERIDLSNSSIGDTIPEWFENILSHILFLDLSNNQIEGRLPRFYGNSSNKIGDQILLMNSNKFEGTLATFPSNVVILDLSKNLLSGHLPQTGGTLNPRLEIINLSNNLFTGSIPAHLCEVSSIQVLDLSQNKFYGRLPSCLGNLTDMNVLDLSNNTITGVIPSSLDSVAYLAKLQLHNNMFEGEIPMSLQNLTELSTMDLGNNLFRGDIPFWLGEKLSYLKFLNLQSNKFTGKIPLQFCQLSSLQYLNLAHNNITGTIPRCFGNLSAMMIMNSKGDYADINQFYYEENIVASMKGRQLLYTKTADFLTSLDLSNNNIVGEIPDALMDLVGLKSLNLFGNLLQGQIPMAIGDLKQLESLDLSNNRLSGRIPQSLTSLNFLSYLNLSFNNLSGAIPVGNQIQTLDGPSIYEGNNGLCGPPVSRSCKENDVSYNHVDEDEGKDGTEGLWFYAGMGPGFVVGSLGLLGSLHFIRSWRVAYFEILENVYDWLMVSILLNLARLRRKVFK